MTDHPTNLNPWRIAGAEPTPEPDAPDVWSAEWPPGGYVCKVCGTPTESEPCQDHQPHAYAAMS